MFVVFTELKPGVSAVMVRTLIRVTFLLTEQLRNHQSEPHQETTSSSHLWSWTTYLLPANTHTETTDAERRQNYEMTCGKTKSRTKPLTKHCSTHREEAKILQHIHILYCPLSLYSWLQLNS